MNFNEEFGRNYDEFCDNFQKMEIDINSSESSDIIISSRRGDCLYYTNMRTQKESKDLLKVIPNDKRFIVLDDPYVRCEIIYGMYVKYDEPRDILIIVMATLCKNENGIYKWKEYYRAFIGGDYTYGNLFLSLENLLDICGQTLISDKAGVYYNDDRCKPSGMREECHKYFGGYPVYFYNNEPMLLEKDHARYSYNYPNTLLKIFGCEREGLNARKGGVVFIPCNDAKQTYNWADMPIPEEAERRMYAFANKAMRDYVKANRGAVPSDETILHMSFLQRTGDEMLLREFYAQFIYYPDIKDCKVELIEACQIEIDSDNPNCYKDKLTESALLWRDDMDGTVLFPNVWLIDECIDILVRVIDSDEAWLDAYCRAIKEMDNKFCIDRDECISLAAGFTRYPCAEKIYAIFRSKGMENARMCKSLLSKASIGSNMVFQIENSLGPIDITQSKLHKILQLPKGMFEALIDEDALRLCSDLKSIFKNEKEYFENMNKDDYTELIKLFKQTMEKFNFSSWVTASLIKLIEIFGVGSWKSYLQHILMKIKDLDEVYDYHEYLALTLALHSDISECKWKVSGDSLKSGLAFLELIHEVAEDSTTYEKLCKDYVDKSEEWRKYTFSDGPYQILYPRTPEDVITEGVKLKHCAKSFVTKVAKGKSILLFIRQKKNPDKPFYTLEICEGKVRQCHGSCNKNITSELAGFLKKFCEAKGIEFNRGEQLLAV